ESVGDLCLTAGATEVYVADNRTTSERIWKVRRNIAEAFALHSDLQANEDLVVPTASIPALVNGLTEIAGRYGVMAPSYGHAGDGNLHTRITPPSDWDDEKWLVTVPDIERELYELTAELGGRISGEHGIGHKRKRHMGIFLSEATLDAMRAVKRAFDPNNILNPGKVFDLPPADK
ncbi:MAG: FAD-binding oxidoreductase, partial [Planctomycetota bacterium]